MPLKDVPGRGWPCWHDLAGIIVLLHQLTEAWEPVTYRGHPTPPHLPNMPFSLGVRVVLLNSVRNSASKLQAVPKSGL